MKHELLVPFYQVWDAHKYLLQYVPEYGSGDCPKHIADACAILDSAERQLRSEMHGILKQEPA